ncbi:MAG: 1-acyl-sn-glycerol-3-phosphate acyltransferase [Marinilabiliales bacterium]|nr:MAG: 1-acyl-sn-glycerol-3-phosphate acyltransferase [Marinilabiliales bacterium]
MSRLIFSSYVWLMIIIITLILSPIFFLVWLITLLFDKKLLVLHHLANFWGSLFTILVPGWKVEISGKENLSKRTKIFVANHQSQEDILVIYRLWIPFRWISKAEVFKIPFYGWFMRLKGDIRLQRSSKASIKKMIIDAEKVLKAGSSITVFPEGTRSKTGKIGNFKEGAFKIAKEAEVPIQPIAIHGTNYPFIYPRGMFKGKHKVQIKVLNEIPYSDFRNKETKLLAEEVKRLIEKEVNNMKMSANVY